jgi:hypothetical protein
MDSAKEENIWQEKRGVSLGATSEPEKASNLGIEERDTRRDAALDFLGQYKNVASVELSKVAAFTRGLRRKIDWRLMPFLFVCYSLTFIDKVLLNVCSNAVAEHSLGH